MSPQSVSRWETAATLPDVMLLPEIARLYGVLVDDLFKPVVKGYPNNAQRLMAVYESSRKPEDFLAAAEEFERLFRTDAATADDWRVYGVIHEYLVYYCIEKVALIWEGIARRLDARGLEIEAQWPRNMAEKCRAQAE